MDKLKRDEILQQGLDRIESYKKVIESIKNGVSEAKSCRNYGVGVNKFRKWCRDGYISETHENEVDESFMEYDDFFSWQDALMYAVTKDKAIVATSNFDDVWKYLKTTLSDREAEILELRYEESMRLKEIADTLNISKERVRQIEDRALRKLRHPKRARILLYGSEYIDALEEFKRATDEVRYKKFNSVFEDLNNKFNSVASELLEFEDDSVRKMIIQESLKKEVFLNFTLDDLDISVRTYNSLKRVGIKDIKGILEYSDKNGLSMIRNFGISCFEELKKELSELGCCKELVFKKE